MKRAIKRFCDMTLGERIVANGWFNGTMRDCLEGMEEFES